MLSACSAPVARSHQHPPNVDPVAFRVHTVVVDMPVARMRALLPALGTADDLMRATIDEQGTRDRLLDVARADPSIGVVVRDDVVVQPGGSARVPVGSSRAASDALDIDVKVAPGRVWEPCILGYTLTRHDSSDGRGSIEKHVADTPMPDGYWLQIDLVPAAGNQRGIVVFLLPEIIWPETGDL
jgi:microcompartment protein CcmK/EutM